MTTEQSDPAPLDITPAAIGAAIIGGVLFGAAAGPLGAVIGVLVGGAAGQALNRLAARSGDSHSRP